MSWLRLPGTAASTGHPENSLDTPVKSAPDPRYQADKDIIRGGVVLGRCNLHLHIVVEDAA